MVAVAQMEVADGAMEIQLGWSDGCCANCQCAWHMTAQPYLRVKRSTKVPKLAKAMHAERMARHKHPEAGRFIKDLTRYLMPENICQIELL